MHNFTPALVAYLIFVAFVTGLIFGSFCNAWAWRLAHGKSISKGRSHCPNCDHVLSVFDLVPLFSYIFLRGRCRYCGKSISPRYPLVELICGTIFVSVLIKFIGYNPLTLIRWLAVLCLLLTMSLVDLETFEIPDRLIVGIALAFFAFVPFTEGFAGIKSGLIGGIGVFVPLMIFVLLADKITGRETMGGGDIKLFTVLGLHFGIVQMLFLIIVSCLFGIIFAIISQKFLSKDQPREIPFAPAIAMSAWFVMLFGAKILDWYMQFFF